MDKEITISQTETDGADLAIENGIHDIEPEDFDQIYTQLDSFDIQCSVPFPWYRILVPKFQTSSRAHDALTRVLGFQLWLIDIVEEEDIERIHCRSIDDEIYEAAIADVADHTGISVDIEEGWLPTKRLYAVLSGLFTSIVFIIDQVIALLLNKISTSDLNMQRHAIIPFPGRESSMDPIVQEMDSNFTIIRTHLLVNWVFLGEKEKHTLYADDYTISQFTSIITLFYQFRLLSIMAFESLFQKSLDRELTGEIKQEYGFRPTRTVSTLISGIYSNRGFVDIQCGLIIENILEGGFSAQTITVGGLSPREKSILSKADRMGANTYYVPHGVGNWYQPFPDTDTTHFAASELEKRAFSRFRNNNSRAKINVTGRPYFHQVSTACCEKADEAEPQESTKTILVATQPYSDHIRRSFLSTIMDTIEKSNGSFDLRIKIHPSEDVHFYEELDVDVPIIDSNLFQELQNSDLVITINSNVGIESIICGTPSICLNLWGAFTRSQYAEHGPVPVLRTTGEVTQWFDSTNSETLESLVTREEEFVEGTYKFDSGVATRIAQFIEC